MGWAPSKEASHKAKEAATKALELDETEVEAHRALAAILTCDQVELGGRGTSVETRDLELESGPRGCPVGILSLSDAHGPQGGGHGADREGAGT